MERLQKRGRFSLNQQDGRIEQFIVFTDIKIPNPEIDP